jgi:hypothetical protein
MVHCLFCSQPYIKNIMAGRADKKPFDNTVVSLKHRVKTISVSTGGTGSELLLHLNYDWIIRHGRVSWNVFIEMRFSRAMGSACKLYHFPAMGMGS